MLFCTIRIVAADIAQLDTVTQSKNIIQSIEVSMRDMPPIEAFPKSHRVAYNYYVGRIYFMEEDYLKVCALVLYARVMTQ